MKKAKRNDRNPILKVRRQLTWVTLILVIVSVMIFALVEYVVYEVLERKVYDPIDAIGMVVPMAVILILFNHWVLKVTDHNFTLLTEGISKVASGNYTVTIDLENAGNFKEIYRNFNKMSRELQGTQTLRDDFVNQFSHEFKTPIMSINGFASLMLEKELPREDQIQYLKIIASESIRLAELAKNTLLISKLETQQMISNKQVYSLDEQLKECLILLEPLWLKKELQLSVELEPVRWLGNKEIMQQLWMNLLNNAIRYTPRKGELGLSLTKADLYLEIKINDTGCGISQEDLPQIFNKYYKGKSSSSLQGLGMGLAICQKIVELCGGEIKVFSRLDEGSEFKVSLPLEEAY